MKQKFLVPFVGFLAFGLVVFFGGNFALSINGHSGVRVAHADQYGQEEALAENDTPAEDSYTQPDVPEEEAGAVEPDYGTPEEDPNFESQDENKAPEDELTTESNTPAEETGTENQPKDEHEAEAE